MHLKSLTQSPDGDGDGFFRAPGGIRRILYQFSESELFKHLLKEVTEAKEACHHSKEQQQSKSSSSKQRKSLARFGFVNALNKEILSLSPPKCLLPSKTACDVKSYTMLVTTTAGFDLRTLFLNLLSWITFDEATLVVVFMPLSTNETLQADAKYGQRILSWHANDEHKVSIEFGSSLWTANYTRFTDANNAIVWQNGNVPSSGNQRGLNAGLELWKQHATAMVASHAVSIRQQTSTSSSSKRNNNNKNATAFCHDAKATIVLQQEESDNAATHATIQLASLSGLVHHASYLCFLSHSVFSSLRRYTTSIQEEQWAIAMALQHLTAQPLLQFPATIKATNNKRRRRLSSEPKHRALSLVEENDLVTAIAGFFGSLPRTCEDCSLNNNHNDGLPWMTKKCQ